MFIVLAAIFTSFSNGLVISSTFVVLSIISFSARSSGVSFIASFAVSFTFLATADVASPYFITMSSVCFSSGALNIIEPFSVVFATLLTPGSTFFMKLGVSVLIVISGVSFISLAVSLLPLVI